ncbi:hypothetical protein H9P43_001319 [Blastocladiella emersonii ATCC 22665]|nr:hypothetical protein H9P43_001319 [Blastocladiella emersonii ATCC 22665]
MVDDDTRHTRARLPFELIESILLHCVVASAPPCHGNGRRSNSSPPPSPTTPTTPMTPLAAEFSAYLFVAPNMTLLRRAVFARLPHCTALAASLAGRVDLLDLRRELALPVACPEGAIDAVSCAGHVAVLAWWAREHAQRPATVRMTYSWRAIQGACRAGHVAVLAWWRDESGLPLEFPTAAPGSGVLSLLTVASVRGHVHVLQWLADGSGGTRAFPLDYTEHAMDAASAEGHVSVLEWWCTAAPKSRAALVPRYSRAAITGACVRGHVPVLEWWRTSGLPMAYDAAAMDLASEHGRVGVLDWWRAAHLYHKVPLFYTAAAMDRASAAGHSAVLAWWRVARLPLEYTAAAVDGASANGLVPILDWWFDAAELAARGKSEVVIELRYSGRALAGATAAGHQRVLEWWVAAAARGKLVLRVPDHVDLRDVALEHGQLELYHWWSAHRDLLTDDVTASEASRLERSPRRVVGTRALRHRLKPAVLARRAQRSLASRYPNTTVCAIQ